MNVRVACPSCSASYGVSDVFVGRTARCNRCGHIFSLSGTTLNQPEDAELEQAPQDRAEFRVGQVFAGRYLIERKLGAGGMGSVFRARDQDLGRVVALKVPHFRLNEDSETVRRFEREARVAASFDHPNLCPVYDVGRVDGIRYLTMPFIEGEALSAILRSGPLEHGRAAGVALAIAVALNEAHAKGVIHRDLKPANVLIHPKRGPVVVDFGLARDGDPDESGRTRTGTLLGTPTYMSPEQVDGDMKAVGPRTDVYALGVLLYELITGRPPFEGNNISAILVKIKIEPPRHPRALRPDVDSELAAIALKAMSKAPADRYPSMQAMGVELRRWLDTHDPRRVARPAPGGRSGTAKPRGRLGWKVAIASVVAVLAAASGVAGWFWTDRGSVRLAIADPRSVHTVLIDGHEVPENATNGSIGLGSGRHTVKIVRSEAPPWIQEFTVERGQVTELPVPMAAFVAVPPVPVPVPVPPPLVDPPVDKGDLVDLVPPATTGVLAAGTQVGESWGDADVGFTLQWCPAGSFLMGSPLGEPARDNSDEDQVFVVLSHGFWIGRHEVTQGLYQSIMGSNPSTNLGDGSGNGSDSLPVDSVTWSEAKTFCQRLTDRERSAGRLPFDWEYRLPTEAEWEYACRAGTTTATAFGDRLSGDQASFNGQLPYNEAPAHPTPAGPTPVGQFAPNDWGLYDMHGNVYEWCEDGYWRLRAGGVDPVAPSDVRRVLRGGSWPSDGYGCRSAYRNPELPESRLNYVGFRMVAAPLGSMVEAPPPDEPESMTPPDTTLPPVTPHPREGARPPVTPN